MRKNMVYSSAVLCAALLIAGKSMPNFEISSNILKDTEHEYSRLITDIDGIMFNASAATENGLYLLKNSHSGKTNIKYINYASQKEIFLCNMPECTHENESCQSYLSPQETAGGVGLFTDNNELYLLRLGSESQNEACQISRMELSGGKREVIYISFANINWPCGYATAMRIKWHRPRTGDMPINNLHSRLFILALLI